MQSLVKLADLRGVLKGDLNAVQTYALSWSVGKDIEEKSEQEIELAKLNVLATNPELYKALFENVSTENIPDIEWVEPKSIEEADRLAEILEQMQMGGEEI